MGGLLIVRAMHVLFHGVLSELIYANVTRVSVAVKLLVRLSQ
jgi:hypothetical protein